MLKGLLVFFLIYNFYPAFGVITHPSLGDEWALEKGEEQRFQAVGRAMSKTELLGTVQLIEVPDSPRLNGRVAITARHVVDKKDDLDFCWDLKDPVSAKAQKTIQHPHADIALIVLDRQIPIDSRFLYKLPGSSYAPQGDIILAGYGWSGRTDIDLYVDDHKKRFLEGDLKTFTQQLATQPNKLSPFSQITFQETFFYNSSMFPNILTGLARPGDSGAIYGIQQGKEEPIVAMWMHTSSHLERTQTTDPELIQLLHKKVCNKDIDVSKDIIKQKYQKIITSKSNDNDDLDGDKYKYLGLLLIPAVIPWIEWELSW